MVSRALYVARQSGYWDTKENICFYRLIFKQTWFWRLSRSSKFHISYCTLLAMFLLFSGRSLLEVVEDACFIPSAHPNQMYRQCFAFHTAVYRNPRNDVSMFHLRWQKCIHIKQCAEMEAENAMAFRHVPNLHITCYVRWKCTNRKHFKL